MTMTGIGTLSFELVCVAFYAEKKSIYLKNSTGIFGSFSALP